MWTNIFGDADKAKERIAAALEKTSDMLNEKASEHASWLKKESEKDSTTYTSLIEIEEQEPRTATQANYNTNNEGQNKVKNFVQQKDEMLGKMQIGWGNVLNATRKHVADAQQQINISGLFQNNSDHRELSLPLDVEALRDAEVVYVTDKLITMGHPYMQSTTDGSITPQRKLAAVGHLLRKRHAGRFMVWDLSEVEYDYSFFDNEVLPFHFPGSPSPPLGMLLKLLLSIESWLKADSRNVAVFHCLTGKGRTSTVLASFLCWTGEAGFHDPVKALEYIAACKRCPPDSLTIPSQRRYASYFSNMLDGVRPHQPPLVLKRIIMSEAPLYSKAPAKLISENSEIVGEEGYAKQFGCAPYLQIFKAGKLLLTTTANLPSDRQDKDDLPFCLPSDGPISFPVEVFIQGDILIRCRHLTRSGQRVSMFRAAFHTGYVATTKVLRLTKSQLDGACTDRRFGDDFFLDLIFEACELNEASKHLVPSMSNVSSDNIEKLDSTEARATEEENQSKTNNDKTKRATSSGNKSISSNEANERRKQGTLSNEQHSKEKEKDVIASTYDSMLHRDSRFWDVIAARRNEHFSNTHANSKQFEEGSSVLSGPTIGRRRDFSKDLGTVASNINNGSTEQGKQIQGISPMDTFSIGDGFGDIFGDSFPKADLQETHVEEKKKAKPSNSRKKDSLMEALMAIDDDLPTSNDQGEGGGKKDSLSQDDALFDNDESGVLKNEKTVGKSKAEGESDVKVNVASTDEDGLSKSDFDKNKESKISESENNPDVAFDLADVTSADGSGFEFEDDDEDDADLEDLENFLTQKK